MTDFIFPFSVHDAADFDGTFAGHVQRGSVNPGFDFAVKRGSRGVAPAAGVIVAVDQGAGGSGGRTLGLDCDNGWGFDFLHLSAEFIVTEGMRVAQGQAIVISGASANGQDDGIDPHCHVSMRPNHAHLYNAGNVDPIPYMSGDGAGVQPAADDVIWDQTRLNVWGYGLVVDGDHGPKTDAAIRDFQAKHGLKVDGIAGPKTDAELAKSPGAGLAVDGQWGPATTSALQSALGVTVDGDFGPESTRALQSKLGVTADGDFGPISKKALQTYLGVTADGEIGPITVSALQSRLNAGTF